jgi:DNA-binding winged helix-turn-helix (wHTH) protein/tetratricopeptide (TPR) repeat protein
MNEQAPQHRLPSPAAQRWAFAGFEFDARREQLSARGVPVPLAPKPRALLEYLLDNPGRVLGKDELMRAIWGQTVVTDDSLVQLVLELRNALADREQRIVKTVPRRGYLFDAHVEPVHALVGASTGKVAGRHWGLWAGVAGALLAVGGLAAWSMQARMGYSVEEERARRFAVFVAPFVEDDSSGEPSQFGRRIAGDISTQFQRFENRVLAHERGAKFVVTGRVLRRNSGVIVIETQLKELSSGTTYPLIQPSFASEDEALRSDLPVRVMRAMWNRRDEILLAAARQPGHQADPVELVYLARNELDLARTEADVRRAELHFEDVLRQDPAAVVALMGHAGVCTFRFRGLFSAAPDKELTECEERARRLYARAPENADAMNAMAFVLQARGRLDEAMLLLRNSLKVSSRNRVGNWLIATVLVKQGKFDEAEPYIRFSRAWAERIDEHGPSDRRWQPLRYQLFADVAFHQGRDDESCQWLRRWATEMPSDGRPYVMLAAIDSLNGREEQAKAHMKRHRELLPRSTAGYVAMMYAASDSAVIAQRARLLEAMKRAGLPDGI